ncbi:MAG: T9SS type A sorting domain-containing protein [Chloroherpetonaceae bacterium]|nr:T9SS type A sorting domain-containing protein [Chloroherpetonaceae bacterium]
MTKAIQQVMQSVRRLAAVWLACWALSLSTAWAQTTYTSISSGNWSDPSIWNTTATGTYPGELSNNAVVTINAGHTVTINVTPPFPLQSITVNSGGTLQFDATGTGRTVIVRNVTVNSGGQFGVILPLSTTTTHTLQLSPLPTDPPNTSTVFNNNGVVGFNQFNNPTEFNICNVVFTRNDEGQQQLIGSGSYDLNNLLMVNSSPTPPPGLNASFNPTPPPSFVFDDPEQTSREQIIGQAGAPAITMRGLAIQNLGGQARGVLAFAGDYKEDNATRVFTPLNIQGDVFLSRGILIWNANPGATLSHTVTGNINIGTSTSEAAYIPAGGGQPDRARFNTGMVLSSAANAVTTLTVQQDILAPDLTHPNEGIGIVLTSPKATAAAGAILNVNGNFNTGNGTTGATLLLTANGFSPLSLPISPPTGTIQFNFGGNFTVKNTSRYNGLRSGFSLSMPLLRFTGGTSISNPAIFYAPKEMWLGTGSETNAISDWEVAPNAFLRVVSGAAMGLMNQRTLFVNGTLICDDGAALIATRTGGGSGVTFLSMGPNGRILVNDVHGLGTGQDTYPSGGAPPDVTLFYGEEAPATGGPIGGWNLTSINTSGTIEYSNNVAAQAITPRNGTSTFAPNVQYHNLVISGLNKNLSGGSAVVGNTLTLSGGIVTVDATDTVRVTNAAPSSVVRTSGHINGRIERAISTVSGSYLYPLGDAALYRPVTLQAQAAASGAALLGQLIPQPGSTVSSAYQSPLQGVSQLRHYQFTNTGTSNLDVTQATVQVNTDDGALNPPNTRVATILQGSTPFQWLNRGGSVSSVPNPITSDPFTETITTTNPNFYVALGTVNVSDNPLPVELVEFVGKATGLGVELRWKTASELNNAGFILLRNGEVVAHYREQAALQGAGTTPLGRAYRYLDEQVREGERYVYQLRSVDFDGTVHEYGWRVEVLGRRVSREFRLEQNYPNPFNPGTVIAFEVPEPAEVRLAVYDLLGREVARLVEGRREAGRYEVRFVASGLSGGIYIYRLEAVSGRGQYVESRKMVLMK